MLPQMVKFVCRWLGGRLLAFGCDRPGTLYYVGRKRPISDLTPEQQDQIRAAYRDTGFAHNDSEEGICICLTEKKAMKVCEESPGRFYEPLPIEQCLPDSAADYLGSHHVRATVPYTAIDARVVNLNDPIHAMAVTNEALRRNQRRRSVQAVIDDLLPGDPVPEHFLLVKDDESSKA